MNAAQLRAGLASLGLGEAPVVVHSSLRSFGRVEGGALAVAEALVSACDTLVVPSGTWDVTGLPYPPGLERANNAAGMAASWDEFDAALQGAQPYSPALPIDRELGAVPEAVRERFDHVRATNPLFAFLAVGEAAQAVIDAERPDWPLGPLEVVESLDGWVLLLGVGHTSNTAIHLAEQRLGRSCFYRCAKVGAGLWAEFANIPGESHLFDDLEPALRPFTRETTIGSCRARLVPIRDVLREATGVIDADSGALLCGNDDCRCGAARRQREAYVNSQQLR